MVVGAKNNNFYDVIDEVLDVHYLMGRRVWLLKCQWYDTDNSKSHRTHAELGYKSINTFRFWFADEPVILAMQGHLVFFIEHKKNGTNCRVVQVVQNKRILDVPEVDDVDNEQLNIAKIVDDGHHVGETVEANTLCRPDADPTVVERSIHLNVIVDDFIDDEDDQLSHQSESSDDE